MSCRIIVDPWTTRVWAAQLHFYMEFSFPVNFYYNNTGTTDMIICKYSTVRRVGAPNSQVGQRSTIIFFQSPSFQSCARYICWMLENTYERNQTWVWASLVVPVVKNLLCNAGDEVSIPGLETKILLALEQLSPRTATTQACVPQLESVKATRKRSWMMQNRSWVPQLRPNK